MKESDPEKQGSSGASEDGPADVDLDLDVGDVDLAPQSAGAPPVAARRTAPPPLPLSALSQPPQEPVAASPSHAPSQVPPYASMAPEPPPRSKLVYGLVLVGFFVVCLAAGALFVRASAPKPAAPAPAPAKATATAQPAPSGSFAPAPKVITINPVDMGGNESP